MKAGQRVQITESHEVIVEGTVIAIRADGGLVIHWDDDPPDTKWIYEWPLKGTMKVVS